jgi:hypothetical protein
VDKRTEGGIQGAGQPPSPIGVAPFKLGTTSMIQFNDAGRDLAIILARPFWILAGIQRFFYRTTMA